MYLQYYNNNYYNIGDTFNVLLLLFSQQIFSYLQINSSMYKHNCTKINRCKKNYKKTGMLNFPVRFVLSLKFFKNSSQVNGIFIQLLFRANKSLRVVKIDA